MDQGRREERFVQEPEVIEPRRADEVGRRREADPHAGEAGHDEEEPALDRTRLHQEDEGTDEHVDETHREEGTATAKDGLEAETPCRDAHINSLAVPNDRVGVHGTGFTRAQVAEEELFERAVGVPVDGDNGVARAEARRFAGIEDLGDDVRPGVVHRPPAEVRAVPPPDDVQPIETIHRGDQRQRDAEVHPMDGNGRRRLQGAHLTLPRLRVRRALLCGGQSPCERSHDEERGGSDRRLREDVAVERVEGLRPGERHVPDQEPSDEQVPAVAVHHPLNPPRRADEAGHPGGGCADDGDPVLHSPEDIHGQGLVGGRRGAEEPLVRHAGDEVCAARDEAADDVGE